MKRNLLILSLLLIGVQLPAQSLIEGAFQLKSEFVKLSNSRNCNYKIGLGTIQSEQENGYVLFLFNHSIGRNNEEFSLLIKPADKLKNAVLLNQTQIQPLDKYGDAIISFYLPNTIIEQLKNRKVKQFCLCQPNQTGNMNAAVKEEIPSDQTASEFFMTYANLFEI